MKMIRVLVVDNDEMVRVTLTSYLNDGRANAGYEWNGSHAQN